MKVELLLPAGNMECLRAAVNNGADAVYLGLGKFNARRRAENFDENNIFGAVEYCHKRGVKVYVAFNTLVKNDELEDFFRLVNVAYCAGADSVIVQDRAFVLYIRKSFPNFEVHLSTQAGVVNSFSVPDDVDRVVLARELGIDEVERIVKKREVEVFVHGALCFSYSGQCLFSSMVGGRSGNRGFCAQPCRRLYNNKYNLSTMDLCLLEKIPDLIRAGVSSFKVEGRLRSPIYVATVARIYRKYIDLYYDDPSSFRVDKKDLDDLKIVFNREFTSGFGFENNVVDSRKPMNRGLFIGVFENGKLKLRSFLKVGDGIGVWFKDDEIKGFQIDKILKVGKSVLEANAGDLVDIGLFAKSGTAVYKTSSVDLKLNLGDEVGMVKHKINKFDLKFDFENVMNDDVPRLFVKCYDEKSAIEADKAGADVIYYDILKEDCEKVKGEIKRAKFFVFTPKIVSDGGVEKICEKMGRVKPDGVLVGNWGFVRFLKGYDLHFDYNLNFFNDLDLEGLEKFLPIVSPELSFEEIDKFQNKRFAVLVHGDLVLMRSKQKLKAPELIDEAGRHFRVREIEGVSEILNCSKIGLFNKVREFLKIGVKYFVIDCEKDVGKFVRIYRKIVDGGDFDDRKIRKGFTTGHFNRGIL